MRDLLRALTRDPAEATARQKVAGGLLILAALLAFSMRWPAWAEAVASLAALGAVIGVCVTYLVLLVERFIARHEPTSYVDTSRGYRGR